MFIMAYSVEVEEAAKKQEEEAKKAKEAAEKEKLPNSGGPAVRSVLLPAAALLVGSGVLAYAIRRHR